MNPTEFILKTKLKDIENATIMQVGNDFLLSIIKTESIVERSIEHIEEISKSLFSSKSSIIN